METSFWKTLKSSFICIQLNGFKYSYSLLAHSQMASSIAIDTNKSICMQLNGFKDRYQKLIIQFNINYLFVHNLIVSSIVNDSTVIFDP